MKYLCKACNKVLESRFRHDYVTCEPDCSNETFVDGGDVYERYGGKDLSLIVPLNPDGTEKKKGK